MVDTEDDSSTGCYCCLFGEPRKMREHRLLWECVCAKGTLKFPMKAVIGPDARTMIITMTVYSTITALVVALSLYAFHYRTRIFVGVIGIVLLIVTVCMHMAVGWSDPGFNAYVEDDGKSNGRNYGPSVYSNSTVSSKRICGRCHVAKERGTHHCHRCNRCLRKHHHHCPFTSSW